MASANSHFAVLSESEVNLTNTFLTYSLCSVVLSQSLYVHLKSNTCTVNNLFNLGYIVIKHLAFRIFTLISENNNNNNNIIIISVNLLYSIGRLQKRVWQNHSLRISTKIQVYKAVVISTLLYGSETWVFTGNTSS